MHESTGELYPELPELFNLDEWTEVGALLGLTQRQQQVARMLCLGWSVERISDELRLDAETTRRHLQGLFRHLKVRDALGVGVRLIVALRAVEARA